MPVTLKGPTFIVDVEPERGADLVQVTDVATGTPLFTVSPTGSVGRRSLPGADSRGQWLAGYPGGWQLLVPNAGPERMHDGVLQGFHGEAAIAQWALVSHSETTCEAETWLSTAPVHLHRSVSTDAGGVTVTDTVSNLSPDVVRARIVQHPAFGAPFLDGHSTLRVDAATLVADADAPGSLARASAVGTPAQVLGVWADADGIRVPGPGSGESLFAAMTDFTSPEVVFESPTRGFGIRLSWDATVYPHAWFWVEANASPGWPWFRRLYAVAVEPANVLPGEGPISDGRLRGGVGVAVEPDRPLTTITRLSRVASAER